MITLHCTAKVLKRFGLEPNPEAMSPTSVLGNWYANLLNVEHQRHVLCVSERTFLPVIMPARQAEFPSELGRYLAEVLRALGIPEARIQGEVGQVSDYSICKTKSRQVLGVMNDFTQMAKYHLPDADPFDTSLWLGESPSKPLEYSSPDRETCKAFEVPTPLRLRSIP